ncbi:hypothetical protein NGF19_07775 [Streptomyces sp. RY43-2]|uniref:Uncharacterized protein n=1 Tax=Streptomyces macrolidinus TaxID=2952607 RepID=A0ABT0ZAA1_9ACTN|nr:hypothetical protein [Streptomyces macrolidinus]MCN9240695.1 hypothetical protein [Streptomyces macrolidinus]
MADTYEPPMPDYRLDGFEAATEAVERRSGCPHPLAGTTGLAVPAAPVVAPRPVLLAVPRPRLGAR